jgi:hypothetical protein
MAVFQSVVRLTPHPVFGLANLALGQFPYIRNVFSRLIKFSYLEGRVSASEAWDLAILADQMLILPRYQMKLSALSSITAPTKLIPIDPTAFRKDEHTCSI